jgi:hypothetical protein
MASHQSPAELIEHFPGYDNVLTLGGLWNYMSKPKYFDKPVHPNVYVSFGLPVGLLPAINAVRAEIRDVRASLVKQQAMLEELLLAVRGNTAESIEIDDVTDAEARERILALFKESSGSLFYDNIAERLRLPLRQTVEICNRLEMDGLIGEPATK